MASLRWMVASEISDQRKINISGNLTAWTLHSKNSCILRKRLLDRDSVRCFRSYASIGGGKTANMPLVRFLSPCVVFHQLRTSSVNFDVTRTRVLNDANMIQSAAEFVHESESRTLAQPDSNTGTFGKDGHHSHLEKLENIHSKRRTRKKQIASNWVTKRKNWEPISRKSNKSIYVRSDVAFSSIEINASINYCNRILKDLEQTSEEKALEFFDWMKRHDKLSGNSYACNLAIRVLSRKEDWNSVEALLEEMKSDPECHLNSQIFNSIIFVCAKRGRIERGTRWFQLMLENGVQPNVATIGMLMGLYRIDSRVSEAEYVFDKMRELKLHNVASYSAMLSIYTRQGMYHKAEEIILLMKEDEIAPNFDNLLVQLNSYCQQGKLSEAESVLESIQESGLAANIRVYNKIITGYGKVGDAESAERIFRGLTVAGLEPDEVTYRQMVECYGRSDNYLQAKQYYEELKRFGFYPSSSNFHTMINLQVRHEDETGVIQTLMDMKAMKCQLSSVLATLIEVYDRVGRIEKLLPILSSSFYHDILIDTSSCFTLVLAFVRNSLLDDASKILQEKRWVDSSYEGRLYHTLICFCKEAGRYEDAVKIFSWMPKLEANTNLQIVCSMIDVYSSMNRFNDAEALYLNLKSSGVPLDVIAYKIVVRMYVKFGSLKDACIILDTVEKSKDIEPDVYLYRDILRIYQQCKLHEKLANVYYRMCRNDDLWDEAMYNCVINCCSHSLPTGEISRLFEEMIERKFAPSTITFNVMIDIYGKAGLPRKAMQVFEMAKERGLVDVISYNTLIAAYGYHKNFKTEVKLGEDETVLESLQESGLASSICVDSTNTGYGKVGDTDSVEHIFRGLTVAGLDPNEVTYRQMVECYGRSDNYLQAKWYYEELKRSGFYPNTSNFYTMINLQARHDDETGVIQTLMDMKEMKCQLSSVLATLIEAYERVGRIEKLLPILSSSFYHDILNDASSCFTLVLAFVRNSLLDDASKILQEKRWVDSSYEGRLYHTLICFCKEAGRYEDAIKIFCWMPILEANTNLQVVCSMIDVYSSMNRFNDAEALYLNLKSSGVPLDMIAYKIVVRMYVNSGSLKDARIVLDTVEKSKDIEPDVYLYQYMLRIYQQCKLHEKLANVYYRMRRKDDLWDEAMYNCVINCCGHSLPTDEISKLFEEMIERKFAPSTITINVMIDIYGKARHPRKAMQVFEMAKERGLVDVISYNTLLAAYGYHKDFKTQVKLGEDETILKSVQESGLAASICVDSTLITGYGIVGDTVSAERIFRDLTVAGLDPNEVTYRQMVECYGRSDNYLQAKWYYEELKRSGFYPNSSNFHTMINLQARHDDETGVIQTLMDMKAMKCQLSSVLATLIEAYERVGRIERLLPILSSSFYHDILIDASSCFTLVLAFVRNSLLDDASKILQEKRWVDSSYEGRLYHTLICFCKEAGRYEDAVKIFSWMPKSEANTNLRIVCSMVDIYSSMNRFNDAEALYLNLKSSGVPLGLIAYKIVVRMYVKSGSLKDACIVLDTIEKSKDIEPDVYLYRDMLRIYQQCKLHEKLANVYYRMRRNDNLWDEAMYNCVINCCGHSLPTEEISRLFEEMIEYKFAPSTVTFNVMIDIYGKAGLPRKAMQVFDMANERGLVDVVSYNTLIAAYGYHKDFKTQVKFGEDEIVLESVQESGLAASICVDSTPITGYEKVGDTESVEHIFRGLAVAGLDPNEVTYRQMVECYGRSDNYLQAKWYYEELKHSGFYPNSSNFHTMINLQARHDDETGVIQTLMDMRAIKCQLSSVLATLIETYDRVGRIERLLPILSSSFYHDILIDASSCFTLVLAFVRNSLLDDASKILQEKRWVDSSYECQLYHTLICFCKEAGRYEDAVKIFSWIPKLEANTNLQIVCSMIDVYSSMNRFNDAEALYLNLKSSGVPLDMIAYKIIVRMYVKSGSLKDACIVLDTVEKSKDIEPDVYLYRKMLRIYQQCKLHEKLANVYYRMCRKEDLWDEAMYNCVINCCGHSLPTDEISRRFEEMIKRKFAPSIITLNVMLDIYGKAGLLRKAKHVFEMGRKLGLVDEISYTTLIAAYGCRKDFKSMEYVFDQMQRSGHAIPLKAYSCMLDAYGKEGKMEKFNLILDKMRQESCSCDLYIYNIMINIYGKKGWIEDVSKVLAEMQNHGLEPDLCSYNALIKAYGIAGMPEEALGVVKEMKAKGIELDRVTFASVISALQRNEDYFNAAMWSVWLREMEKNV